MSNTVSNKTTYTEQPVVAKSPQAEGPSMGFFGIGIVINVVMITAYFIWAYKQWKKNQRNDE
jgi:hypothetical protein